MDACIDDTPGKHQGEQLHGQGHRKVDHHHKEVGNIADQVHHDSALGDHGGVYEGEHAHTTESGDSDEFGSTPS